jgi:hypothetical protein
VASAAALVVAVVAYSLFRSGGSSGAPPTSSLFGGTALGLVLGGAAMACMVAASALTLRKRLKNWRLGKTSRWMEAHVWLGVLALPLVLLHSGFRLGGALTTWTTVLLIASWTSGVVGLVLQQVLPRLMTEQLPRETIFEQIDHVLELLRAEARTIVESVAGSLEAPAAPAKPKPAKEGSEPVKEFFLTEVQPYLAAARPHGAPFDLPTTAQVQRAHLKRLVPAALHDAVDDLFDVCDERRQVERQRRMHFWLHGWLFVHVPVSWALLAAALFHAIRALRF